jgi:LmbE family N-acetylglucosaminyl deacetylase
MTVAVMSPHTDDAIFSLGAYLATRDDVTIVSPMAAIPTDPAGRAKHETLRAEHGRACELIGAAHIEGPFLDDVYPPSPPAAIGAWLAPFLTSGVTVFVPLGIHHPDHLLISDLLIGMLDDTAPVLFYAELPYRVDYPAKAAARLAHVAPLTEITLAHDYTAKAAAVACYASQIDDSVRARVLVDEQLWARR